MPEYWYNVNTHEIEEDAMSDWSQLIGPYKTREEAQHALEKVKARNEAWDKGEDRLDRFRRPALRGRWRSRGPGTVPGESHDRRLTAVADFSHLSFSPGEGECQRLPASHTGKMPTRVTRTRGVRVTDLGRLAAAWASSTIALIITGWLLPDLSASGWWPYAIVAAAAGVFGLVLRPILVEVSARIGWIAVLLVALLGQALITYLAIRWSRHRATPWTRR